MPKQLPSISAEYKKQVKNSIFYVLTFFFAYFILIAISIGLIILLGYLAVQLIILKPGYITLVVGAGIFSIGLFTFIFLVKFIFSSFSNHTENYIEINRNQEPELFALIDTVVDEVGTQKPKRVYLSGDVNASVFYDSPFWSMFMPVKKNLSIGMGLINSTTVSELKAVLAHEFGHFSQKSMKVGSYVNQANKIIYNMLNDNESFNNMMANWASFNVFIAFFVKISFFIISGILWILSKFYDFLYLKHMSLSRQMEFHADAIATHVVGSDVNISSLLRLDISGMSLNNAATFYINSDIPINTKDIYENQRTLMTYYASEHKNKLENDLPKIEVEDLEKYNNSKLVIEDQWSSHPTIQQRVQNIISQKIISEDIDNRLSRNIIKNFQSFAEKLTQKLFYINRIKFNQNFLSNEEFFEKFQEKYTNYNFPEIFNSYYNQKNPALMELPGFENSQLTFEELFSDQKVNLVFEKNTIEQEIQTLSFISNKQLKIKTFDYDGRKYSAKESEKVTKIAQERLDQINSEIEKNDNNILKFFSFKCNDEQRIELSEMIKAFIETDKDYEHYLKEFNDFSTHTYFMTKTLPFEEIRKHRANLLSKEEIFKGALDKMISTSVLKENISLETRMMFKDYINAENLYFEHDHYINSQVEMLGKVLGKYTESLGEAYFKNKKKLLDYKAQLLN
jgi:Zn-dependent protease with chaperone function